ncbi:MAG: CAP domain-containing protein [Sulfuritalea sp.]|nr:CAP domain-containing protein [Sulfuritalea sp.]
MPLRIASCLLLLGLSFPAAAGDLYDTINRLRDGDGTCEAQDLPPLKPQAALKRAARELARGHPLERSLRTAGYRATRAKALQFSGKGIGGQVARTLERQGYCEKLQDVTMTEIGIYQDARRVWIVMAAPFAPVVAMDEAAAGQRVLDLVNQMRRSRRHCGNTVFNAAPPLRWNDALAEAARLHSEEMAQFNFLSHSGRDGSTAAQRIERAGYRYRAIGENIAGGQLQPEEAVAGWLNSPGHCANLMSPAFTEMGVAFAVNRQSRMGVYWTQEFGARR